MPSIDPGRVTDVAVCVVTAPDGRVLLAERTARQVAAGFWELPGGKIEPGEAPSLTAARELREETGLEPLAMAPWMTYEHQFPTRRLRLHFFRARAWSGTPHGCEGQRLAWVHPHAPHVGPVLPSNDRALFALGLPPAYTLVDATAQDPVHDVLTRLEDRLSEGTRLIRLRLSSTTPGQSAALLARVSALAKSFPSARILTGSAMDARRAGLSGVHSCAQDLRRLTSRPPVTVWAATCHGEADLKRAASLGADFVVLSPILPDPDRPYQAPVGWEGLQRCVANWPVPVYAQGGVGPNHAEVARQAGAAGIVLDDARPQRGLLRHARGAARRQYDEMRV